MILETLCNEKVQKRKYCSGCQSNAGLAWSYLNNSVTQSRQAESARQITKICLLLKPKSYGFSWQWTGLCAWEKGNFHSQNFTVEWKRMFASIYMCMWQKREWSQMFSSQMCFRQSKLLLVAVENKFSSAGNAMLFVLCDIIWYNFHWIFFFLEIRLKP